MHNGKQSTRMISERSSHHGCSKPNSFDATQSTMDFAAGLLTNIADQNGEDANVTLEQTISFLSKLWQFKVVTSMEPVIVALLYLERLHTKGVLVRFQVHFASSICLLIATKYLEDCPFDNASIAMLLDISVYDLNVLELHVLQILEWNVNITAEEFVAAKSTILRLCDMNAKKEDCQEKQACLSQCNKTRTFRRTITC